MNGGLDRFFAGAKRSPVHTRLQWPRSPGGSHQEPPMAPSPPSFDHLPSSPAAARAPYAAHPTHEQLCRNELRMAAWRARAGPGGYGTAVVESVKKKKDDEKA